MNLKIPIGLVLSASPLGLSLYDSGSRKRWDLKALEQKHFASLLFYCRQKRTREAIVQYLIQIAGVEKEVAESSVDVLIQDGLLTPDNELSSESAAEPNTNWFQNRWDSPFYFHRHTNLLPKLDYQTDIQKDVDLMESYVAKEAPPNNYKEYAEKEIILLEQEPPIAGRHFSDVLKPQFAPTVSGSLSFQEFSWLMRLGYGQTSARKFLVSGVHVAKTSPSGGSRHPTEVYPIVLSVEGVPQGLYHYNVKRHGLELLHQGDHLPLLKKHAFLNPQAPGFSPSVVFILSTLFDRSMFRYRDSRSYRVVHFDLGHLAQTTAYLASALQRNSFREYSFNDSPMDRFLGLDGIFESAMAVLAVG